MGSYYFLSSPFRKTIGSKWQEVSARSVSRGCWRQSWMAFHRGVADVAKGTGSDGGQSSQNTHSGFGNEAISLRATLLELSCLRFCPLPLPFAPLPLVDARSLLSSNRSRLPLAPAIEVHARISLVLGEKKGVFLEITTGEYFGRNTLLAFGLPARGEYAVEKEYSLGGKGKEGKDEDVRAKMRKGEVRRGNKRKRTRFGW